MDAAGLARLDAEAEEISQKLMALKDENRQLEEGAIRRSYFDREETDG